MLAGGRAPHVPVTRGASVEGTQWLTGLLWPGASAEFHVSHGSPGAAETATTLSAGPPGHAARATA